MQRSGVESFQFAPLSAEFVTMAKELEQLGGGPVAVGSVRVVGIVHEAARDKVLWPQPHGLSVRNPLLSSTKPVDQSVKFFPMSECYGASAMPAASELPVVLEIVDCLCRGFSANMLFTGQGSRTKEGALLKEDGVSPSHSLFWEVLRRIFEFAAEPEQDVMLGLAAWQLLDRDAFDLLSNTRLAMHNSFKTVECADLEVTNALLAHAERAARQRQEAAHHHSPSHLFAKLCIHNRKKGTISYLHAIDLAARDPAANDAKFSAADRELSLQLTALTKMLQQLKECKTNGTITAARETKLTEMLFPILTDNAMTWIIASLLDGDSNFSVSQSTMQPLVGVTDIKVACRHLAAVESPELTALQSPSSVLLVSDLPDAFPATPPRQQPPDSPILDLHALASATVQSPADAAVQLSRWLAGERPKPGRLPDPTEHAPNMPEQLPQKSSDSAIQDSQLRPNNAHSDTPRFVVHRALEQEAARRVEGLAATMQLPSNATTTAENGVPVPEGPRPEPSRSPDLAAVMDEFKSLMESLTMDELKARVQADSPPSDCSMGANDQTRQEIDRLLRGLESVPSSNGGATEGNDHHQADADDDADHDAVHTSSTHTKCDASRESSNSQLCSTDISAAFHHQTRHILGRAWEASSQDQDSSEHAHGAAVDRVSDEQRSDSQPYSHMSLNVLKANYDTLLHALEEEQRRRVIATDKLAMFEREFQEKETQYQLALDTSKVSEVRLRSQLRKLASQHSLNQAFDEYEREIGRLRAECQELNKRNIVLELQLSEAFTTPMGTGDDAAPRSSMNSPVTRSAALMKSSLKKLQKENTELRQKLEEIKRNERQQLVSSRVAKDASQKVQQLSAKLTETTDALRREQLAAAQATAELQRARDALTSASHQEMTLRNENAMMGERIIALQQKLYDYELEEKRRIALDKYSKKHTRKSDAVPRRENGSSPQRLPTEQPLAPRNDGVDTSNTALAMPLDLVLQLAAPQTAEVLVTLQENVKRLAPGLMPLVTKLRTSLAEEHANLSALEVTRASLNTAPSPNSRIPAAVALPTQRFANHR